MNDLGFRLPENRAPGAGVVAIQRHAGTAGKGTHGTGSTRARRMAASPLLGSVKQTLRAANCMYSRNARDTTFGCDWLGWARAGGSYFFSSRRGNSEGLLVPFHCFLYFCYMQIYVVITLLLVYGCCFFSGAVVMYFSYVYCSMIT